MRALKIAGAAIAAAIVVIALIAVIGIPSSFLTSTIQERVERETGYRLTINGGAKISLWPSLNISLNDVVLQDPKDREINNRLTASSIEAEVTLASLWSGRPKVTDLLIVRPVLNLPLQRVRDANPPPRKPSTAATDANVTIEHVSVTGGTVVFSNVRDRVENRIETINADATIDSDRKVVVTGQARAADRPLKFVIKVTAPQPPIERQTVPAEFTLEAPTLLPAQLTGKAELRLNGSVVQINSVTGTIGEGAFNGWASVDVASKPLVKLDLDFQRLNLAATAAQPGAAAQPWSNATIDLNGLNYVDAQARISAAEVMIGDGRFAPVELDATLVNGVLKAQLTNLGAYDGQANGDLTVDASTANPTFAMRADLAGIRALPLLHSLADFDNIDGKMQAKVSVRSSGTSQRAIMANLAGSAFAVFQDGSIRGLNVAQMVRNLTASTQSGWQENAEQATDLAQLSASFKIDKGQAVTTDLNLVGPLVRMTGAGTIDLGTKQIGFRVEPKLVMTTEGQGRKSEPVGFGIPVMIEGPWSAPRIYPEMQGMLDNPEGAYAKLREMGKGLFGPNGISLDTIGGLMKGSANPGQPGSGAGTPPNNPLGGQLGETLGNLIQQGLGGGGLGGGLGGQGATPPAQPQQRPASQGRSLTAPPAEPQQPAPPPPSQAAEPSQDSQAMNEVLRQLFNR